MRITRIELFRAPMVMRVPLKVAIGLTEVSQSLFVRIHTDNGITGIGEGNIFPPVVGETADNVWAVAPFLAQALIGTDPRDIEGRAKQMKRMLPHNSTTRSAFEIALWDVLGKAANLPLFALLGGRQRAVMTDNTAGIDTPEVMAERAAGFKARGFEAVKIKLGTDVKTDIARMAAIRAAVGPDFQIRIDANQGWSRTEARTMLAALEAYRPALVEQPLIKADIDGMAMLRRETRIPLMADESLFDEHDALRLVVAEACDYLNIKLAKAGGIWTALKINAIGETAGLPCMVGCMTDSGISLSAAVHLVSARDNIIFADLDSADMLDVDPVLGGFAYEPGGRLTPKSLPGLGVEIDPAYLAGLDTSVVE